MTSLDESEDKVVEWVEAWHLGDCIKKEKAGALGDCIKKMRTGHLGNCIRKIRNQSCVEMEW